MKNILVVEDDQFTIDFYKYIFKKAKHNVIVLEEGDKIIETLQAKDIHLIIMDINLKNTYLKGAKIDGIKLSRFIKENKNLSHIPVLLVTAYSMDKKEDFLFKNSLAEDFITKPILDFNFLIDKVNTLMKFDGKE
jgi:CheY-like chemotaxis protein